MNTNRALIGRLIVAFSLLVTGAARAADVAGSKPNIVFILADDLGYGDLGCYGQEQIHTPNVDKLAAEGMRFTDAYAGSTVCAPSRCTLMTGKHTGHTSIRGNVAGSKLSVTADVTVAELMKKAGYSTACIGKWGLGEAGTDAVPNKRGFDSYYGYLNQVHAHNSWPTFLWRNEEKEKLANEVPNETPLGAGVASKKVQFSNDLFLQEAIKYLDGRKGKSEPFFLYLPFTIPHANNEGKKMGMEVPDDGEYAAKDWPEQEKHKAAAITRLDGYVGHIMAKLKELGVDDNTLVIFTSDNGAHQEGGVDPKFFSSSGPLRGIKRNLYEGGFRVPFIARWPGKVAAATENHDPIAFWDFMPTACALAGAKSPDGIDGVSYLPALLAQKEPALSERFLYWEFKEGKKEGLAVRWGNWKAVRETPGKPLELYDLSTDIGETKDLASEKPDVVKKIEEYLKTARTEPVTAK
jgi:arylsulfatase A-like enzyme